LRRHHMPFGAKVLENGETRSPGGPGFCGEGERLYASEDVTRPRVELPGWSVLWHLAE